MRITAKERIGLVTTLAALAIMSLAAIHPPALSECRVQKELFGGWTWARCAPVNCDPLQGVCTHADTIVYNGHVYVACNCGGIVSELCRGAFRALGDGNDEIVCVDNGCPGGPQYCVSYAIETSWCDACTCTAPPI